jgi:peptidyl-prolyl cis-trans isomerase C
MKIKLSCAVAVLSFLCMEYVSAGALKKDFAKEKQKEEKKEEGTAANEEENEDSNEEVNENTASKESSKKENNVAQNATIPAAEEAASSNPKEVPASTEKKKITGDPVVLRIGRKEFKRSQVIEDLKLIPPQLVKGVPQDKLFAMLVDQKMSTYLMVEQAKKASMDKTKEFLERIERMKEELLARTFLMKEIAPKSENESVLKARYTKYLVEFKKGKEHQLHHIMVSSEDEVKKVLESLGKGEDFIKLAKEKSIAPSKDKGGDEGYIPLNILPPQIKDKLTVLKKGEYTKEAIKTEAGYHIFKVGDNRDPVAQKYEEIKDTLKQMIVQEEIMKLIGRLEKQYNVEKFNEDGTPFLGHIAPATPVP